MSQPYLQLETIFWPRLSCILMILRSLVSKILFHKMFRYVHVAKGDGWQWQWHWDLDKFSLMKKMPKQRFIKMPNVESIFMYECQLH